MTIEGFKRRIAIFFVNKVFCGTKPCYWNVKRALLNWAGFKIGKGTKVVGPVRIYGDLVVGDNTWIGTGLTVHGNGTVFIGSNCDVAPDVTFLTGSHIVGNKERRAGKGLTFKIVVNDGTWIGAASTLVGDIILGKSCVIGACSLVNKSWEDNVMIAGVPAKMIKELEIH